MGRLLIVGVCGFAWVAASANATILVHEEFTHADGNLVGKTPTPGPGDTWAAHSGAGAMPVQVSSGAITLNQGSGSREDVNTGFGGTAAGAGDVFYAAYDVAVSGASATSVYFAMFMEGTSFFNARVWVTAPTAGGDYRFAISNDNSITDADGEVFTGDLTFGTTYRVVTSYDYDAGVGTLWLNPVNSGSPSISASDPGFSDEVHTFAFRQAGGDSSQVIDNLCVGTSFDEANLCIPEPVSVALLGLGGLMLRRRKIA